LELAAREADEANWGVLEALELEATTMAMRCAEYHTLASTPSSRRAGCLSRSTTTTGSLFTLPLHARPDALGATDFDRGVFLTLDRRQTASACLRAPL
jgi:hypothetical protein